MGSVRNATRLWNGQILDLRKKRKQSKSTPNLKTPVGPIIATHVVKKANEKKSN